METTIKNEIDRIYKAVMESYIRLDEMETPDADAPGADVFYDALKLYEDTLDTIKKFRNSAL